MGAPYSGQVISTSKLDSVLHRQRDLISIHHHQFNRDDDDNWAYVGGDVIQKIYRYISLADQLITAESRSMMIMVMALMMIILAEIWKVFHKMMMMMLV